MGRPARVRRGSKRGSLWLTTILAAGAVIGSLSYLIWGSKIALPEDRADFHLFLLAGQSNMVGRARLERDGEVARKPHPRVLTLDRDGRWVVAEDPIHFDDGAGVGPGTSFGDALADADPGIVVGLIPCAVGGSPMGAWEPGAVFEPAGTRPFDEAAGRIRTALEDGVIKGVLWHQGESDGIDAGTASAYEGRLRKLIARFRELAGEPSLPVLVGELGRYLKPVPEAPGALAMVKNAHARVTGSDRRAALVSSEGLGHKGDGLHFDTVATREFGRRFAAAYLSLTDGG